MSRLFWLSNEQVERITPFFPKVRGVSRANDRKVLSGIIYAIKHGLQWTDARAEYGPRKTLYNQQLPQSALGSKAPLQVMKDWHKFKPELFKKQPYDLPGCENSHIPAGHMAVS